MSQDTGLYFARFPKNFTKLRAVLVVVKSGLDDKNCLGPRRSYREIVFTEPDVLIAPESQDNFVSERAVVILENHILESGKFCELLQKFSLQQKSSIPLTRSLFLYCFEFVLTHRLAPLWNKIGKHFIQGRDFLGEENKMCAIQAEFSLTDKITLAVKAQLIKLPKPKVKDFGVSPNILEKFQQSDDFSVHGYSLENNKCLVLPSLTAGYITRISHRDSEGIDFKKYWKVMYGFRLPDSPQQHVFYNVQFPMSNEVFSYPEYCIRSKAPQVFERCDQQAIFKSFLEDLTLRMPSVCATPLTFTSSTLYSTSSLHLASVSQQTNLTRTPVLLNASQPFTFTKSAGGISNASNKATQVIGFPCQSGIVVSSSSAYGTRSSLGIRTQVSQNIDHTSVVELSKTPLTKPYVPCFTKNNSDKEKRLSKKRATPKGGEVRREKPLVACFKKSICARKMSTSALANTGLHNEKKVAHRDRSVLALHKEDARGVNTLNEVSPYTQQRIGSQVMVERNSSLLGQPKQRVQTQSSKIQKKTVKEPKADVIVDVRKMVAENKLSKVRATAITNWLKSEGVKCKCKEKKQELMFKVYQYMGLKQAEP